MNPEFDFANPIIGGQENLRNIYQEWLRTWGGMTDEDIEEITKITFDKVGWEEKDEGEQRAYQERLQRQINALRTLDNWLDRK